MKLEERSYSGRLFRPRPVITIDVHTNLILIVTPWGTRSSAKKITQIILDSFSSAKLDSESTTPFPHLDCLNSLGNQLRTSLQVANENIRNTENNSEWTTGAEIFALAKNEQDVVWAQIGHPFPIFMRKGFHPQPMSVGIDSAFEFSKSDHLLPPLPNRLLGTFRELNLFVGTFQLQPDDQILMVARSTLPADLWALPSPQSGLDEITKILSRSQEDLPFWVGLLKFE